MSDSMKIGVSIFNGGGFVKKEYFWMKANENNLFRVLPPLFSLADKGQYAKYYATHKIVLVDPVPAGSTEKGKYNVYNFHCIEKVDHKTKLVERHCPYCDMERKNKAIYDDAKNRGASKEQLEEFRNKNVAPYEKDKKFYVNAVNLENKVGLLPLGVKAFKALQERLSDLQKNYAGLDATGVNGVFLNFKKTQKFKGDRDTVYSVDPAMDTSMVNGIPSSQLKVHSLTTDFIEVIRTSARDLGDMFTAITAEEMINILQTPPETKKALLDKLFGRGKKDEVTTGHNVGTTGVESVTRIEIKNGDVNYHAPDPFKQAPAMVSPAVAPAATTIMVPPTLVPTPAPLQATQASIPVPVSVGFPVNPMQPTVASTPAQMTDEEFVRAFGGA